MRTTSISRCGRTGAVRRLALASAIAGTALHGGAVAANSAVAGYQSGRDLFVKCRDSSPHGQEYCFAYIAASADSVRAYQSWIGSNDICIPSGTSQGQLRDNFVDYMVRHSARLDDQASSLVILSMADTFPCGTAKGATTPR